MYLLDLEPILYILIEYIHSIYRKYGIPMDCTYVGKAFYGMCQYIKDNSLAVDLFLFLPEICAKIS